MRAYREFIFIMNLSHGVFDPVKLLEQPIKNEPRYKYYLGRGNNREVIKALMKRRFWWGETDNLSEANFVWTQLKVNSYYQQQQTIVRGQEFYVEGADALVPISDPKSPTKKGHLYRAPLPIEALMKVLTGNQIKQYKKFKNSASNDNNILEKYMNFEARLKFFTRLQAVS